MRKKLCLILAAIWCIQSFSSSPAHAGPPGEILVSAAMSLKNVFEELGKTYEAGHRGTKIRFNFGASGDLIRQIEGGAAIDALASASEKEMADLEKRGLVVPGSRVNFASNAVVLVVPSHTKVRLKSFADLNLREIKRIAMGNPKTTPAGRYAAEVLQYYKTMPAVQDKLIYAENVRQVLEYVARGEVDAGIVYATDTMLGAKGVAAVATAPGVSHGPIIYPFALIKGTKNGGLANGFKALLTSAEGRRILNKHGFVTVRNNVPGRKR